jgi:hypothetical protein
LGTRPAGPAPVAVVRAGDDDAVTAFFGGELAHVGHELFCIGLSLPLHFDEGYFAIVRALAFRAFRFENRVSVIDVFSNREKRRWA